MRRALALFALLLLPACGDNTDTSTSSTDLRVAAAALPAASVSAEVSASVASTTDPERPMLASWTVVIRNNSNVPANVWFVNATLRDAHSGAQVWPRGMLSLGVTDITTLVGTNRLPAGGSLSVPGSIQYAIVSGGREALLTIAVQVLDDNGHRLTATAQTDVH